MSGITNNIAKQVTQVRAMVPLVHNITNYVTVNDVANAVLAIGGSPIMADDLEETADITSICSTLVLNIGTLNKTTVTSMLASGKRANELNIPVVFDPVGVGASSLRNDTTKKLLEQVKISILRGNLSEISFIAGLEANTRGVDSSEEDEKNDGIQIARSVAKKLGCVVAITGAIDIISDGDKVVKIENGNKLLSKVTGTGCMTTALVGTFAGATKDFFLAATAGVASMGIAGELAYESAGERGTGSFHMAIIDALSKLDANIFIKRAKINEE